MNLHRLLLAMMVSSIMLGLLIFGSAQAQVESSSGDGSTATVTLKIDGWTCRSCEKDIRHALLEVPGVRSAEVSYPRGGAIVSVELGRVTHDQLIKAVESASTLLSTYHATVVPNGTLSEASTGTGGVADLLKGLLK